MSHYGLGWATRDLRATSTPVPGPRPVQAPSSTPFCSTRSSSNTRFELVSGWGEGVVFICLDGIQVRWLRLTGCDQDTIYTVLLGDG